MKATTTIATLALASGCLAQHGVSSGSYSMTLGNGLSSYDSHGRMAEESIIVEDFVNYHRHDIAVPKNEDAAISIDYDPALAGVPGRTILQVGLATPYRQNLEKTSKDVNISLVIDVSGSMEGDKLNYVKQALKTFVEELDNGVYLSLVAFSSDAQVVTATTRLTADRSLLYHAIENLHTLGSTNINAGMMLGYEQIEKSYERGMNARLILLTDGMTNAGVTDHETILSNSKKYNDKGIEISTIGVGSQLDFTLLRHLAENGRGSNHFIGEGERDIEKVFVSELESLLYNLGKNPELTIELPQGCRIHKIYGFKPRYISNNSVAIKLENLNAGTTQVILMDVEFDGKHGGTVKTLLEYEKDGRTYIARETRRCNPGDGPTNKQIPKNYAIALMADALKHYAADYSKGLTPGKTGMQDALAFTDKNTDTKDEDIRRVYDLLKRL